MKYTIEIFLRPWANDYGTLERPGYVYEIFDEERRLVHKADSPIDYDRARRDAVKFVEAQPRFESYKVIDSKPN